MNYKLLYNLQFFAEGDSDGGSNSDIGDSTDDGDNGTVDVKALADLLSDKDKELKELKNQVDELKKANAKMVVQMSTGNKETAKTFEENLLDLVGAKPRKE